MFDEDSRRPFFYNQITGEIRWRRPRFNKPMPRPLCGNCEYFEASLECRSAGVLLRGVPPDGAFGGKRAKHPFRLVRCVW